MEIGSSPYLWKSFVLARWGACSTAIDWKKFYKEKCESFNPRQTMKLVLSEIPLRAKQIDLTMSKGGFVTTEEGKMLQQSELLVSMKSRL